MRPIDWAETNAVCETFTENEDTMTREIVTRIAEKWTLWTLAELAEANAPLRFSRLMEKVEGVSQKSLTKALRQLERDGMVTRAVYAEVPPRVEYEATSLAVEMLELVHPLWMWAASNVKQFQAAQAAYDRKHTASPPVNSVMDSNFKQSNGISVRGS
jgi:DNA-binding HxlR family transcriptional regulator